MVVGITSSKLSLSPSSPPITSLLYHPTSSSLALIHSDSSFSLYPTFTPFSSSLLGPPKTLIPPPSSSAAFVSINNTHVVFVTGGPHNGGSRVLLRFYLMGKDGIFERTRVEGGGFGQRGVDFFGGDGVVDVSHGVRVLLSGCVNYFGLYSFSDSKVWVFGLRLCGDDKCLRLRLVKCAVIDCCLPVSSICVSSKWLVLGEVNGVRAFPLRSLVKGSGGCRKSRVSRGKVERLSGNGEGLNLKVRNGVVKPFSERYEFDRSLVNVNLSKSKVMGNGHANNAVGVCSSNSKLDSDQPVKPRSLKLRQDSGDVGMQFVMFDNSIIKGTESKVAQHKRTKAISIHALSQHKFSILDSNGDVYLLLLSKSDSTKLRQLTGIVQAQQIAAFPDKAADTQTIWLSDGLYSVYKLVVPCTENTENEHDMSSNEGEVIQCSVTEAIFAGESIQDMISLAASTVLLLGRGEIRGVVKIIKYFE